MRDKDLVSSVNKSCLHSLGSLTKICKHADIVKARLADCSGDTLHPFKSQVSKIEGSERIFCFPDFGSCGEDYPIAGLNLTRKAVRFRLNVVAMFYQRSSGRFSTMAHLNRWYVENKKDKGLVQGSVEIPQEIVKNRTHLM